MAAAFPDRLAELVERKRSQLVVGLDPRPELLPVELRGAAHASRAAASVIAPARCHVVVSRIGASYRGPGRIARRLADRAARRAGGLP